MNSLPIVCRLLALLKLHRQNCARCSVRETRGPEMVKRLEELSWKAQQGSESQEKDGDSRVG